MENNTCFQGVQRVQRALLQINPDKQKNQGAASDTPGRKNKQENSNEKTLASRAPSLNEQELMNRSKPKKTHCTRSA